jgi:hypothetical protein
MEMILKKARVSRMPRAYSLADGHQRAIVRPPVENGWRAIKKPLASNQDEAPLTSLPAPQVIVPRFHESYRVVLHYIGTASFGI